MVKKTSFKAECPLYASTILNKNTFAVGGGGGIGAHGVKNRIAVYDVLKREQTDAYDLPAGSDSVMCLASAGKHAVVAGVNIPGNEKRLLGCAVLPVSEEGKLQSNGKPIILDDSSDEQVYLRKLVVRGNLLAAATSTDDGVVYVLKPKNITTTEQAEKNEKTTDYVWCQEDLKVEKIRLGEEALDIALSDIKAGSVLATLTSSSIDLRLVSSPHVSATLKPAEKHQWSHIAYMGKGEFAASSVYGNRAGAYVTVFKATKKEDNIVVEVLRTFKIHGFKTVTSFDATGAFIAVANGNGDICVYNAVTKAVLRKLKAVHTLPVTSLSLSSVDRETIVSTSMDGSVVVLTDIYGGSSVFGYALLILSVLACLLAAAVFYISEKEDRFISAPTEIPSSISVPYMTPTPTATEQQTHAEHIVAADLHEFHGAGHGPVVHHYDEEIRYGGLKPEHNVQEHNVQEHDVHERDVHEPGKEEHHRDYHHPGYIVAGLHAQHGTGNGPIVHQVTDLKEEHEHVQGSLNEGVHESTPEQKEPVHEPQEPTPEHQKEESVHPSEPQEQSPEPAQSETGRTHHEHRDYHHPGYVVAELHPEHGMGHGPVVQTLENVAEQAHPPHAEHIEYVNPVHDEV